MSRTKMTDEERAAYRAEKREQAEGHLDRLLTEAGWQAWLTLRSRLHSYSWTNQALIAAQAFEQAALAEDGDSRAPDTPCAMRPTLVKAAWKWKRDGYHPAKGTRGLYIWAFRNRRRKGDDAWTCCGQRRTKHTCPECGKSDHYFVLAPVFDASQVRSFETGEAPDLAPPSTEPIEGDRPGLDLLTGLVTWAEEERLADSIDVEAVSEEGEYGSWNTKTRHLRICATGPNGEHLPPNRRLRTLIHELAHASGITCRHPVPLPAGGSVDLTYAEAEVIVECVAYVVASTVGLDTSGESIPYMAGWGGEDARERVRTFAALIDHTAKRLEAPCLALIEATEQTTTTREEVPA